MTGNLTEQRGYPKVHGDHVGSLQDISRLNDLLLKTENQYQRKLHEAAKVPFADRLHDFLILIISFGLAKIPDRLSEIEERARRVHQKFSPLISEIGQEAAQIRLDAEQLSEIDRRFVISLRVFSLSSGYTSNWSEISKAVKERDGYHCRHCGASHLVLHVHHVIPLSTGGSNATSNLMTLCARCHARKHPHMRR